MLTLLAKKEVFEWLKSGQKTVDIRKGKPRQGDRVLFVSGPHKLEMRVIASQSGMIGELVRADNFKKIIPTAGSVDEALAYLRRIYPDVDGVFTAYFISC